MCRADSKRWGVVFHICRSVHSPDLCLHVQGKFANAMAEVASTDSTRTTTNQSSAAIVSTPISKPGTPVYECEPCDIASIWLVKILIADLRQL